MRTFIFMVALALAACNSVLGIEDVELEPTTHNPTPDAGSPDADRSSCKVDAAFPLVSSNTMLALLQRLTSGGAHIFFQLNGDERPDDFSIQLYDNGGGHNKLNTPGTYPLLPADKAFGTCGICVRLYADFDDTTSTFGQQYMALPQGSLTLSVADESRMVGSMHNLELREVIISTNPSTTTEVANGCTTHVDEVQFDLTYSTSLARWLPTSSFGTRAPSGSP